MDRLCSWLWIGLGLAGSALGGCGSGSSTANGKDAGLSNGAGGSTATTPSNDAGASGGNSVPVPDAGANTLVGTFQVKLTGAVDGSPATTAVIGKVYDGPTPGTIIWENPQTDGDCTLTTPRVPFCNTPCGGSAACVADDTCEAYPTAHDVGAVMVSGLRTTGGASSFTMTAISNAYQPPAGTTLAYPPFSEGDAVSFVASGGALPGFTLNATGIAPLVLTSTSIELKSGDPVNLTWTPGASANGSINVKLDISHHGGTKGQILCDTKDTGSLTISAALVKKLIGLGVAGYPSVIVTRHSDGSAVISAGRVDLIVSSVVEQAITVEGLTSCTADSDCPSGKTCQTDLSCE
ncbi:MAG TPA: hypothetical protein VHC69_20830 [Polyangiaceae bacterium]|nr:hypothetical protein [Polyangiaceae bacterium]